VTIVQHISELAAAVMPDVVSDFAALHPSAAAVSWEVSTRALPQQGVPPRVTWVPTRDDYGPPEKRTRGGQSTERSLGTRVAGITCECWGTDADATEDLLECLLRHLILKAGPAKVGVSIVSGQWVEQTGAATLGESYALSITMPVDIRASRTAGARVVVTPSLDTTTANPSPADATLDSGDLP